MPRTNSLKRPHIKAEILESIVGTSPEDPSWELQAERILGVKTKRHVRRAHKEYHRQTQQHREHLKRTR